MPKKKARAYEVQLPDQRVVMFRELGTGDLRQAMEAGAASKVQEARQFEISLAGLRASIVKINDEEIPPHLLIGSLWDDHFSIVETQLLMAAWNRVHMPTEAEADAAAGGVKAVSGGI